MIRHTLISCLLTIFLFGGGALAQESAKKAPPPKIKAAEKAEEIQEDQKSYKDFKKLSRRTAPSDLLEEAAMLKDKAPGEALDKVREALGLSLALGDELSEARSHVLIGEINESIEEWGLARENYLQAYEKFHARQSPKTGPVTVSVTDDQRTLRGLGNTSLKLGDFNAALQYFQQALNLRLDRSQRIDRTIDLSEVYYQMGNYAEALSVLDKLPPPGGKFSSANTVDTRVQNQKAKIFARLNDITQTKSLYDNSLSQLRTNKGDAEGAKSLQETKEEIAGVLRGQNLYDDEIELRNKSIEFNLENKKFDEVANDKVEISKTLVAKGEDAAALREIEEAARIADTLENPKAQANAYLTLADLYEKNGRPNQALGAYRKYSDAVTRSQRIQEERQLTNSSLLRQQRDIEELSKDVSVGKREYAIEQATVSRQRLIIYGLLFILLITTVTSYYIYKNAQASKVANQLLALKSLRSQMNPHFIFNALHHIQQYIYRNDAKSSMTYLNSFSRLIRLILEHSDVETTSLEEEIEMLAHYLTLQQSGNPALTFEINTAPDLPAADIHIPVMLLQPFVENAVIHGVKNREQGHITLQFSSSSQYLQVVITDNGKGLHAAAGNTANTLHRSMGRSIVNQRIAEFNKANKQAIQLKIENATADAGYPGTAVHLWIPLTIVPES